MPADSSGFVGTKMKGYPLWNFNKILIPTNVTQSVLDWRLQLSYVRLVDRPFSLTSKLNANFKILVRLGKNLATHDGSVLRQRLQCPWCSENVSFRYLCEFSIYHHLPEMNMRCPVDDEVAQIDEGFPDPKKAYLFISLLRQASQSISVMRLLVPNVSAGPRSAIA